MAISVRLLEFNNAKTESPLIVNWRERTTPEANLFLIQQRLGGRHDVASV